MGRAPCCDKANVKRGPWSPEEDAKLKAYIEQHGTGGNWIALPQKIGLKRCGKSCRLRWLNYLRPNIKHGGFSEEEDNIICSLYVSIGSRWSIIAAQLPGRTDNDIKNYWNTRLKKKLLVAAKQQQRKEQQQAQAQAQPGLNQQQDMIKTQSSHTADAENMHTQLITPSWASSSIQHYYSDLDNVHPSLRSNHQYHHQQPHMYSNSNALTHTINSHYPYHHGIISIQLPQHNLSIPASINTKNLINPPPPLVVTATDNINNNSSRGSCHDSPQIFEGGFESFPNEWSELMCVNVKPQQQVSDAILQVQDYYGLDMGTGSTGTASTESTSWGDISSHSHLHLYSPLVSQYEAPMPEQHDVVVFQDSAYFGMQ